MDSEEIKINGFTFFRSYYESLSDLDPEPRLRIYDAIFGYAFDGIAPQLSNVESVVFKLVKPTIDKSIQKYISSVQNGKKGGRGGKDDPAGTQRNPEKPSETQQNPSRTQSEAGKGNRIEDLGSGIQDMGLGSGIQDCESSSKDSGQKNKDTGFAPPSLADVQQYITDNGMCVSADDFYNYYSSNGWTIKGSKMADWQAAVRSWHSRSKSTGKQPRRTDLDDIM